MAIRDQLKFTVRNARALRTNLFVLSADVRRELEAVILKAAKDTVVRIRETCALDTGYMSAHAKAKLSPTRLTFQAGWWREDFIGQMDWNVPEREITSFYPVAVENGFHTRSGTFVAGQPSLPGALASTQQSIIDGVEKAIQQSARKAEGRARGWLGD